jgi:hypothetical protein
MTPLPIPPGAELWPNSPPQVGNLFPIDWPKIYLPTERTPVGVYYAVDTNCIWQATWEGSQADQGFFSDRLVHVALRRALFHRLVLLKLNLNAIRSVFNGKCIIANTSFSAPYKGELLPGAKVWCVSLATSSRELTWSDTPTNRLLKTYGLLHLTKQECVTHRQCLVEANLRGIVDATHV